MIAAAFWSVTLGIVGGAFLIATGGLALGFVSELIDVHPDRKVWVVVSLLALVIAGAACIGGSVALGTVAWP